MKYKLLTVITLSLIMLMLMPTVLEATATLTTTRIIIVGSIDPSLGYDEIVNGTTTFLVARNRPTSKRTFYHNVSRFEWKLASVEAPPETPGSYYDNLTGKYHYDILIAEPYELTVPDPSGKVTVFSNTIFQNTGSTPKTKTILHPDGTSQSILCVAGQTSDDPYARNLTVKIHNWKYPGGYLVDTTIVQSSFNKSYDVTNIVAERGINNVSITLNTYVGKWNLQSYFWVSTIGVDVYIVMIPDVPMSSVSDMHAVRQGVETACIVKPLVHLDIWKGLTYLEVVDVPTYQYIIEHPDYVRPIGFCGESGIIVVNAHGEVFPVPSGIDRDLWLDTISLAAQKKGLTWVQVGGYPFYYNSSGLNMKTEVGISGFQRFLQRILGRNDIDCSPNQEGYDVPLGGGYNNRLWGYGLVSGGLHEEYPLRIGESYPLDDDLWTEGTADQNQSDLSEVSHQNSAYTLVSMLTFTPSASQKVCLKKVKLDVKTAGNTAYYKITYQFGPGTETTLVTDESFLDTVYVTKTHTCALNGDFGEALTVKIYTKVDGPYNGDTVYSKNAYSYYDILTYDWDPDQAGLGITLDTSDKQQGTCSVRVVATYVTWAGTTLTLPTAEKVDGNEYTKMNFYLKAGSSFNGEGRVYLYSSQDPPTNYVYQDISVALDQWNYIQLNVGQKNKDQWSGHPTTFDWSNIEKIRIVLYFDSTSSGTFRIDNIFFDKGVSNLADLLDVMYYDDESTGIRYLTLGLIGFGSPNQILQSDEAVGYYVYNGASDEDCDYNKGKYSMAVAAWTKISIIASGSTDVYYQDIFGTRHYMGRVKCQVAWSRADPPVNPDDTWRVRFVTSTISYLACVSEIGLLWDANAPLKISGTSSGTEFQFIKYESTTLYDLSQYSWQKTIVQGVLWILISIILIPFTPPAWQYAVAVAIGVGFSQTVTELAFESPSPVTGPAYVDLALKDYSEASMVDANGTEYRQLQSFGVTEISLEQLADGGASETLIFKLGQKGKYVFQESECWAQGIQTFQKTIIVEPRHSADYNTEPAKPSTPSGPTSGYTYVTYRYSTSTTDPDGDYVRYTFYWGDGTTTTTKWYESDAPADASHYWTSPGTPYYISVQAQDSQGAYSDMSSYLAVTISDPLCAMKTLTNGSFYVPNITTCLLRVEMLFMNLTGDQTGGESPYDSIEHYPDGWAEISDLYFVAIHFGTQEEDSTWEYMADIVPDRFIDISDIYAIRYGQSETYTIPPDLSEVTVTFNTGEERKPDNDGFVTIPQNAANFTVKRNGTPIGAMITFW